MDDSALMGVADRLAYPYEQRQPFVSREWAPLTRVAAPADVRVVVSKDQPEMGGCLVEAGPSRRTAGWLAVSGSAAEVRRLADWRFEAGQESSQAGVIYVNVQPADESAGSEETAYAHG